MYNIFFFLLHLEILVGIIHTYKYKENITHKYMRLYNFHHDFHITIAKILLKTMQKFNKI